MVLCAGWVPSAWSQVFVGEASEGGGVVLSNFQSDDAPRLLIAPDVRHADAKVPAAVARSSTAIGPLPQAGQIHSVVASIARDVGLAPELIHAVIKAESNYDPRAVSPKGAMGLMQLMPATAKRFGAKDPFLAQDNVRAGASYLKWLMGYFQGNVELVLAAYNAGEQAVVRAGHKVPQYPETQAYVRRIMARLRATEAVPL